MFSIIIKNQARKRARVPDGSYDFDGDGAVGQLDHFIGRCFDGDRSPPPTHPPPSPL